MKRRRKFKNHSHELIEDGDIYLRLCHVCLRLNEATAPVTECSRCQTPFPTEGEHALKETQADADEDLTVSPRRITFTVTGLSVVW